MTVSKYVSVLLDRSTVTAIQAILSMKTKGPAQVSDNILYIHVQKYVHFKSSGLKSSRNRFAKILESVLNQ